MNVLIAGCGFAGGAIAKRFRDAGNAVWGLRRDASRLPAHVLPLAGDLADPASLRSIPENLDIVVYAASPDSSDASAYERTYIGGVRNVLDAIAKRSPRLRRFVLTSSTGVYGRTDGGWVDEATPPEPRSARSEMLIAGEQALLASGTPAVVIRLGGLYGPGRRRLLDNVRAGRAECVTGLTQYSNRIHRDDVAAAIDHVARLHEPASLYLGVDDEPAERCEVLHWLAGRMHAPEPPQRPARPEDAQQSNKRCSNRRLKDSGFIFRFPTYREGYTDVLARMNGEGLM